MGGSDQWGNIVAGVDLIRRIEGKSAHALTIPLIVKSDGTKFGKTASGSVWLDPSMTSPYSFFQFFLNTDDRDLVQLLKSYSFKSREELEGIFRRTRSQPWSSKSPSRACVRSYWLHSWPRDSASSRESLASSLRSGGVARFG